ncbi:glycosyltransferase family 4 protein [Roseomonas sp. BN140053]|uniref:glycosyltransferase family 4 protein n=1 Tax=Roseomonas sp. BN140053 TaxID=3391898 RepID=UPI0039E9CBC6
MTLWVEVGDLLDYAAVRKRLSGIQRLAFELCRALAGTPGVRFCRAAPPRGTLLAVDWAELAALYDRLSGGDAAPTADATGHAVVLSHLHPLPVPRRRGAVRRAAGRLPQAVRFPLARATLAQQAALVNLGQALGGLVGLMPGLANRAGRDAPVVREAVAPAAGDTLLIPGAPWSHPSYGAALGRLKARFRLRVAMIVYDLIAVNHPEWSDPGLIRSFGPWLRGTLPQADHVLAISQATARDLADHVAREGIDPAPAISVFPVGAGFGLPRDVSPAVPPPAGDPGYVLFVSTLEARKNHALAFRAWRRLLSELPPEAVPRLVFAGGTGWLVQDLLGQIRNTAHLGGKLVTIGTPSDAELRLLYRDCRFTLFPSFSEGWGLPVTESLSFGRVCIASDRGAVPEAGGEFCLYIDPDNVSAATAVLRDAIAQPGRIAALEDRIREEYRPRPWADVAAEVRALLPGAGQQAP